MTTEQVDEIQEDETQDEVQVDEAQDDEAHDDQDIVEILKTTTTETPNIRFIVIMYKKYVEDHDGYCSEREDNYVIKTYFKRTFPVPKKFCMDWDEEDIAQFFTPVPWYTCDCCMTRIVISSYKWKKRVSGICNNYSTFMTNK